MSDARWRVEHGDCRTLLRTLPDQSIDAIVTDPPYELGFMGKAWDSTGIAYQVDVWRECLRVLKHGGHLLAFGGSRTYHRLACAVEDAGFQIRDQIMWVYGSGFPKSLDVSKAIDKAAGAKRNIIGERRGVVKGTGGRYNWHTDSESVGQTIIRDSMPATDAAKQWQGWGTALKPAHEPIVLARKPLDGTVAQNVLWYGTGALNIDGCRVEGADGDGVWGASNATVNHQDRMFNGSMNPDYRSQRHSLGRFPANLIHDGSDEVLQLFPDSKSPATVTRGGARQMSFGMGEQVDVPWYDDSGSAARFFYCAKASKTDRNEGLEELPAHAPVFGDNGGTYRGLSASKNPQANHHPTVKPTMLMRYLVRLVTQPDGVVLDPFTGSGSTGKACVLEGFRFVGFEQSADYVAIAQARINYAEQHHGEG